MVGYVHTAGAYELDFLIRYPAGKEKLIQACTSLDDPATRERETRALAGGCPATSPGQSAPYQPRHSGSFRHTEGHYRTRGVGLVAAGNVRA